MDFLTILILDLSLPTQPFDHRGSNQLHIFHRHDLEDRCRAFSFSNPKFSGLNQHLRLPKADYRKRNLFDKLLEHGLSG